MTVRQDDELLTTKLDKWHVFVISSAIGMIATSTYLTNHYFDFYFSGNLGGGSLCDINSFFSCDTSTSSPLSNIAGAPISIVGIFLGIVLLIGSLFPNREFERSHYFILLINALGCLFLFCYSLFILGGLCPFCTIYYLFSGLAFYAFYKKSTFGKPNFIILVVYAFILLSAGGLAKYFFDKDASKLDQLASSLLEQYNKLPNLGLPELESPHRIASSFQNFADAPIQISVFSDFQCPSCKMLSEMLHPLSRQFKDKINIQYYFYPLDFNCNPEMKQQLHPYACQAAYIAHCSGEKFSEVHDQIFSDQAQLSNDYLEDLSKKYNVEECVKSPQTKESVVKLIEQGRTFNVKSTPTMLVNGVKIEGALPINQFKIILNYLVEKNGKK